MDEYQQHHTVLVSLNVEGLDTNNNFLEIIVTTNRVILTEYFLCLVY